MRYSAGEGIAEDYKEAVKWYEKAAEQGDISSQVNLGVMYFMGQGGPPDYVQAHMWYSVAAANGDEEAGRLRNDVEERMTFLNVESAKKLARRWIEIYGISTPNKPTGGDCPG